MCGLYFWKNCLSFVLDMSTLRIWLRLVWTSAWAYGCNNCDYVDDVLVMLSASRSSSVRIPVFPPRQGVTDWYQSKVIENQIMPPRMMTRSAGRPVAASLGRGMGRQAGRGGGRTGGRSSDQGNGRIDGQGGQVGGQGSEVNDGDQGRGQGNGRNQNVDAINDNIQGDVRNVIENNDHRGCTYKEFLACNPKEYDGKGGAIVYTR
ncbi:hypothetical protein Tco_0868612 [Tanacetum coccineum]